jgi:putative acetyltransferase
MNKRAVVIRESSLSDSQAVLNLYKYVAETPGGLARLAFEVTPIYVESFLSAASLRGLGLVAEIDGEIAAEIHGYSPEIFCFSHVLTDLTIAVAPAQQGTGVGRLLFAEFLRRVAEDRPHISRVELIARESNTRALAFYESLGFVREGELRGRILNADGSLENDIPMALTPGSGLSSMHFS